MKKIVIGAVCLALGAGVVRAGVQPGLNWLVKADDGSKAYMSDDLAEVLRHTEELGETPKTIRPLRGSVGPFEPGDGGSVTQRVECTCEFVISCANTTVDFSAEGGGRVALDGAGGSENFQIKVAGGATNVVIRNVEFGRRDEGCRHALLVEGGCEVRLEGCVTVNGQGVTVWGGDGGPAETVLSVTNSIIACTNGTDRCAVAVSNATLNVLSGAIILAEYELSDISQPDGVRAIDARDSLVNVFDGAWIAGGKWHGEIEGNIETKRIYLNSDSTFGCFRSKGWDFVCETYIEKSEKALIWAEEMNYTEAMFYMSATVKIEAFPDKTFYYSNTPDADEQVRNHPAVKAYEQEVRMRTVDRIFGITGNGSGIRLDGGRIVLNGGVVGGYSLDAVPFDGFVRDSVNENDAWPEYREEYAWFIPYSDVFRDIYSGPLTYEDVELMMEIIEQTRDGSLFNFDRDDVGADVNGYGLQYGARGYDGIRIERGDLVVPVGSTVLVNVGNDALSFSTNGNVGVENVLLADGRFRGYSWHYDENAWEIGCCSRVAWRDTPDVPDGVLRYSWNDYSQDGGSLCWNARLGEIFSAGSVRARFSGYTRGYGKCMYGLSDQQTGTGLLSDYDYHFDSANDIRWSACASNIAPYCYCNILDPDLTPGESPLFPYGVIALGDDDALADGISADDPRFVYCDLMGDMNSFEAEPDRYYADASILAPSGIDGWNVANSGEWADRRIRYIVKDAFGFVATNFIDEATTLVNAAGDEVGVIVDGCLQHPVVRQPNGYGRVYLQWRPTVTCEEMYLCASNRASGVAEQEGVTYIDREITVFWDGKLPGEGGRSNTYRMRFDPAIVEIGNTEVPDPLDGCGRNVHTWPRQHRIEYLVEGASSPSLELLSSCAEFSELDAILGVAPLLGVWPLLDYVDVDGEFLGWRLADATSGQTVMLSMNTWNDVDPDAFQEGDLLALSNAVAHVPRYTRTCLTAEPIVRAVTPVGCPTSIGAVAWSNAFDAVTTVRMDIPDHAVDLGLLTVGGFALRPVRVSRGWNVSVEPRCWLCDGVEYATLAEASAAGATNAVPVFADADGNELPPRSVSEIVLNAASTRLLSTVWENAPLPEGLALSAAVCAKNVEGLADVARAADGNAMLVVSAKLREDVEAADALEAAVSNRLEQIALGETIGFSLGYFNLAGKVGEAETNEFSSAVQVTVPWLVNDRILYGVSRRFGDEVECLPERSEADGDEWYELDAEKGTVTLSVRRLGDFALGALVQDAFCLVVVHGGGKSLGDADPLSVATNFTLTVVGLEYTADDFGGFAARVAGEHEGEYAINFFFTRKPEGFDGEIEVIPGAFTITDDGRIVSKWAAEDLAAGYPTNGYVHVRLGCDPAMGKVRGEKVYKLNKKTGSVKVSISATAAKGYVFAGWYLDPGFSAPATFDKAKDYRNASQSITVTDNTYLFARFVEKTSTADPITWFRYAGAGYCGADASWLAEEETWYQGVQLPTNGCAVAFGSLSLPTVKVSGLPSGVKFDKQALRFTGAPTACSTERKPFFTVKVSVKNKAGATDVLVKYVRVEPLPAWAVGNFAGAYSEGAVETGAFTATVGKTGKFSGKVKVTDPKVTVTLSAKSFSGVDELDGSLCYFVEPTVKYRDPATKKTVTAVGSLTLAEGVDEEAGRGVLVGEDKGAALRAVQKLK